MKSRRRKIVKRVATTGKTVRPRITRIAWRTLVSRIASRAVLEWAEPFERASLIAALPDLADANPRLLPSAPNQNAIRVLDSDLSYKIIIHMLADPKDCLSAGREGTPPRLDEGINNLRTILLQSFQRILEQKSWYSITDILHALGRAGFDTAEQGRLVVNEAVRGNAWEFLRHTLDRLAKDGQDIASIFPALSWDGAGIAATGGNALKHAIASKRIDHVIDILKVLSRSSLEIGQIGGDAVNEAIRLKQWHCVPRILETLSDVGVNIGHIRNDSLREAIRRNAWSYIPRILRLPASDETDVAELGREVLREAIRHDAWLYLAEILDALSEGGQDIVDAVRSLSEHGLNVAERGQDALHESINQNAWGHAVATLDALSRAGVNLSIVGTNALETALERRQWHCIIRILLALTRSGVDIKAIGKGVLKKFVEEDQWVYVPSILTALSRAGVEMEELGRETCRDAIQRNALQSVGEILGSLAREGIDVRSVAMEALSEAIQQNAWLEIADIFDALNTGGEDMNDILTYLSKDGWDIGDLIQDGLRIAVEQRERHSVATPWRSISRMLNVLPWEAEDIALILRRLSEDGVDINVIGREALGNAIEQVEWFTVSKIFPALSLAGIDIAAIGARALREGISGRAPATTSLMLFILSKVGLDLIWTQGSGKSVASLHAEREMVAAPFDPIPPRGRNVRLKTRRDVSEF